MCVVSAKNLLVKKIYSLPLPDLKELIEAVFLRKKRDQEQRAPLNPLYVSKSTAVNYFFGLQEAQRF